MKVIKSRFVLTHKFEDVEVDIQAMTPGERNSVADKCLKRTISRDADGNPSTNIEYDFQSERKEIPAMSVIGWRGFEDEDGAEIPFSKENLSMLMEYVDGFAEFVREKVSETNAAKAKHDEDLQKN